MSIDNKIENLVWILPRPSESLYKGSFPLHFEKKLFKLFKIKKGILQPFGGKSEYGLRCDFKLEVNPNINCDAHFLPFESNSFDFVLLDPPYSNEEANEIYNTPDLKVITFLTESARVCKPNGHIAVYHRLMLPRPPQTILRKRIFIGLRTWHSARVCQIYQKHPCFHHKEKEVENCRICFDKFLINKYNSVIRGKQLSIFEGEK